MWRFTIITLLLNFQVQAQKDSMLIDAKRYQPKPAYIEGGASVFQVNGTLTTSYFLAANWKRNMQTKWTKELSLFVREENPFSNNYYRKLTLHTLNYGMGYEFTRKHLFFKPSIGAGIHYLRMIDFFKGYQYNVGIQVNPRFQYGFAFNRFRITLVTEAHICLSYFQYFYANGQNANPDKKFPIDYIGRASTNLTFSYKLN